MGILALQPLASGVTVVIDAMGKQISARRIDEALDGKGGLVLPQRGLGDPRFGKPVRYCAGSTVIGSTVLLPPRRTSKWSRGLDAPPEFPALAMVWPFFTVSPFLTSKASLLP